MIEGHERCLRLEAMKDTAGLEIMRGVEGMEAT